MLQATSRLDAAAVRADFPILGQLIHGKPLAFLDSASSSQKPEVVIQALDDYYRTTNANVHRGVYQLSERATTRMEAARATLARFLNAPSPRQVIFTRNTTEAINLVAYSWGRQNVGPGDVIVTTEMEHHSNLVPWQALAQERGARLEFIGIDDDGRLRLTDLTAHLAGGRVRLVAVTHVSNVLGTINPVASIIEQAHAAGAVVLVDGAQSVPHLPTDVQALDCDFLAFSGHKMLGPMGVGGLYGRRSLLEAMPPFLYGGSMIRTVGRTESTWADLPWKFEAGTPSAGDAIGLGVAIDYLTGLGMAAVHQHELDLIAYALPRLRALPGVTIFGPEGDDRAGVVPFTVEGVHPHDLASILDGEGVAVRAGHHCCQPLMARYGLTATARASFYVYTTEADVDTLVRGIQVAQQVFGV
ncbi:MAG: cysteine desulfurase [Chloroflexi bacterium]|nr:cysteine desulfurase [Chloroflexota bacterium]